MGGVVFLYKKLFSKTTSITVKPEGIIFNKRGKTVFGGGEDRSPYRCGRPLFLHLDEGDVLSPCDDEYFTSLEKKNLRAALEAKLNVNRPAAKQLKI